MVFRWTGNGNGKHAVKRGYDEAGEKTLAKGLRQGDPDAFAALFGLYRLRIYNYVARMVGDSEDAKDITQEVFLKAFRQIPCNGNGLAIKPWLYKVATTTCLDHLRARKRRAETTPMPHDDVPAHGDAYEHVETNHLVERTLARLSERHRLVLVLKDLHGLRHDEIAVILGISRGATETLLFRARASFRRAFLELSGIETPTAGCREAERVALALAGTEVAHEEKERLAEHARKCPTCRKTLDTGVLATTGLAMFLPDLPVPTGLDPSWLAGAAGSLAGSAGGGGGAAGGGLLSHLGAALSTKAAVVAAAATLTATGGGVAVKQVRDRTHRDAQAAKTAAPAAPTGVAATAGAVATVPGGSVTPADAAQVLHDNAPRRADHHRNLRARVDADAVAASDAAGSAASADDATADQSDNAPPGLTKDSGDKSATRPDHPAKVDKKSGKPNKDTAASTGNTTASPHGNGNGNGHADKKKPKVPQGGDSLDKSPGQGQPESGGSQGGKKGDSTGKGKSATKKGSVEQPAADAADSAVN
jgi:RNA polymerase sigma-70 factor (ECF subfamily)